MKVKKNSWHYWLLDFTNSKMLKNIWKWGHKPTLCEYFWNVVWAVIQFTVLIIASIALLCLLGCGLWMIVCAIALLAYPLIGYHDIFNYENGLAVILLSMFMGTMGGLIGWITDEIKFAPEYLKRPFRKLFNKVGTKIVESEAKAPVLIVEAYKAHKSKFCPLIEIED